MTDKNYLERLAQDLADKGKLIEAGWVAMRLTALPLTASSTQIDEMRLAYLAGAQHLFSSIIGMLDPGEEPTDADLRRMDLIAEEMDAVYKELCARYGDFKTRGNA